MVLLAAFAIGLYIREVRQKNRAAESESEAPAELETKQPEIRPRLVRESRKRFRNPSAEERVAPREQIDNIRQRWADMSEQEREEFRAKMLEIFDARREAGRRFRNSALEERNRFRESFMGIKTRWEDIQRKKDKSLGIKCVKVLTPYGKEMIKVR